MSGLHEFYDPVLYDLNVGHAPRVGPVYLERLRDLPVSSVVMEIGAGTGDVLLPFARRGHRVVGTDNSEPMIAFFQDRVGREDAAVRERVTVLAAELPAVPARPGIGAVLLPNDLISHLHGDEILHQAFTNCLRAIEPGGRILLDIWRFDVVELARMAGPDGLARAHGFFEIGDGTHLRVCEQSNYDQGSGLVTSSFSYESVAADGQVTGTRYRMLTMYPRRLREVTAALELAGFADVRADPGAFGGRPDHVLVTARAGHGR